ncbi:MAG: type II toxin-antitoxin system VapC family toxin [Thermomicrobiales bacterium]
MLILDTNVFSEFIRPVMAPEVERWLIGLDSSSFFLTATTVAEILYGIARMPDGRKKREAAEAAEGFMGDFSGRLIPFDAESAVHYADIVSTRESMGRRVSVPDGQIAAICRQHGATLATRNVKDFLHTGVELLNPWDAKAG